MWHILPFEILQKTKGLFLVWALGLLFCLLTGFTWIWILNLCLTKILLKPLSIRAWFWLSWVSYVNNIPPNIMMISEAKKRGQQYPYGGLFTFCKINMYGLECFRCVYHEILSIMYLTFLPSDWDFTELRIMVHHPCTC